MIKRLSIIFLVMLVLVSLVGVQTVDAKKSKKGGITEEQLTQMSTTVDTLTKKMYGHGLFSPEDNQNLISIKMKLDDQMLVAPDPTIAPLYYRLAILLKSRGLKDDAVDAFQTILENFADTALAPKAAAQLKLMGVAIALPTKPGAAAAQ